MNTQLLSSESHPASPPVPDRSAARSMIFLAVCIALQMTSYVMILPLFARRFGALGAGVNALGISSMAYALAATVAAPFMGAVSDRLGRRPVVLGSLAVYVLAFTGYLFAPSALAIILLRGLAGAFTAGLMPAATGMVADLAPLDRRARWIGFLSGGASIGWIIGPILGGLLYDRWGYAVALLAAVGMALAALLAGLLGLRETRFRTLPLPVSSAPRLPWAGLRGALPSPLAPFLFVLLIFFAVLFAWAFIEPRFMFYAYDDLHWDSAWLGLVMSTYGIAMVIGEFGLGRLSDDLGRKPVIIAGLLLFSAQFLGLALSRNDWVIVVAFVLAGLGNALYDPALSASLLDVAPEQHQARLLGLKSTAGSLGSIAGPALVVLFTPFVPPQGIFLIAACMVGLTIVLAVFVRTAPRVTRRALQSDAAL